MRYTEAEQLRSEIGTVEQFLAATPAGAILVRRSWESRLKVLRERLAEIETRPEMRSLSLTFRGAPVEGSRSIDATFATKAVRAFVEATDTVTASLVAKDLHERGPLPATGGRSLRIVDTAVGSFGFELELPPPSEAPQAIDEQQATRLGTEVPDPCEEAVATTMKLLARAATDDEDAISDLIAEIHPRAAAKVRAFASVLADHDALFAVAFGGEEVRFDRPEQVRQVVASLADGDISEENEEHGGTLLGVLPESRRFEARLADGKVILGKVDRSVADIGELKTAWVDREAILHLRVIRVRSRTRYILTGAAARPAPAADGEAR